LEVAVSTHFLQTAPVNRKGEYIASRWVTIAAHGSEEMAHRSAAMMSLSGWVLVDPVNSRRRGRGGPIANGVRVISLLELLESGPQEVFDAIVDLTNEEAEYLISTHLGYEAA
jgi:hypothetical protein